MGKEELVQIEGSVETIIYKNEETGFAVIELGMDDESLTVVGELSAVAEGEILKVTGAYSSHSKFGNQFKAVMVERRLPATASAIYKYLSSGVIKGIGAVLAKRIVDAFGDQTLEIVEKTPERLSEIKGISPKKATALIEEFKQVFGLRAVMLFLAKHGLTVTESVMVWNRWQTLAIDLITQNPYILCTDVVEIPFEHADRIADFYDIPKDSFERIQAAFIYILKQNIYNGHTSLPKSKLIETTIALVELHRLDVDNVLEKSIADKVLFELQKQQAFIYLPEYYLSERMIASRLLTMICVTENNTPNIEQIIDLLEEETHLKYETSQRKAIELALCYDVMILTGGPGTGKTTTLNAIIKLLESQGKNVLMAAPTGKAAKRMSDITKKDAKTIHRLLEVGFKEKNNDKINFIRNESNPLNCDCVVIDEMSMVDTLLFESLVIALPPNCKLILVGDSDQLPCVGAGNVLKDLIESTVIPVVQLKEIFRQAAQSLIVTNAHKIVTGEMPELDDKKNDFFFMSRQDGESVTQTVVDLCANRLPNHYHFSPVDDIQILAPSRKGITGIYELNKRLQGALNPKSPSKKEFISGFYTYRQGDKVMQVKNDYDIEWIKDEEKGVGIFNGDIGRILLIDKSLGILTIDFDGRVATYTFDMAIKLELAYAVTVHKSQGSEFEAVIIPILGGYEKLFFRNLLYTAVTRAKKMVVLVGKRSKIKLMVDNNIKTFRYTGLKHFLMQ